MTAHAAAVQRCEVCADDATQTRDGRLLCDRDSCLSRTPGTRDQEQGTRNDSGEGVSRGLYVVGPPGVREEDRREPELLGLIRDHDRGLLEPADVRLGELPANATPAMRRVAEDVRLLIGLRLMSMDTWRGGTVGSAECAPSQP